MTERIRNSTGYQQSSKMADLGPRKSLFVLVIVIGCFAVLWPKVFYPMLVGSAQQHMKPSDIDRTTGCCDVISDADVNTIKIMSELCKSIIQKNNETPLSGKEIVSQCRVAVLKTCGIDISAVLQEQVRLGATVKQILEEVRSLNGSLCLKYNFGVNPWKLGVPHRVTIRAESVKQERPPHLKSELVHPAFRERGRAIPNIQQTSPKSSAPPRIVEGRPAPIPGMRPPMGGAGHVVPPSTKGTSSMSVIMPIYTIGIVIFFTYTLMKLLFKKQPDSLGGAMYPPVEPDREFRKDVFESEKSHLASRYAKDGVASKLGVSELDQLRRRLRETELAMERIVAQMAKVPLRSKDEHTLANGNVTSGKVDQDQTSVKVLGMEMTASCEGGEKWNRPDSPVKPVQSPPSPVPEEPPQEIYLEGALPAQSKLLVADSATETQPNEIASDPAVVLAGKMTLSVISLDSNEEEAVEENKIGEVNGVEEVDESKYTTVSNATAAEKDISEEEQNTDGGGIDGDAVEEIQNEEAPILEYNSINNVNGLDFHEQVDELNVKKEIETAARDFIENELRAAIEEANPITQELKEELKDIDELLYDQIRKEEEAELQAVLENNTKKPDEIVVAAEQVAEISEQSIEAKTQEVLVEEPVETEQKAEIVNNVEKEEVVTLENDGEVSPQEQVAAISDETAENEIFTKEEEVVLQEKTAEIADEVVFTKQKEEVVSQEKTAEIADEIADEVFTKQEAEVVPQEKTAEIADEIAEDEVFTKQEDKVVPEEQTAEIADETPKQETYQKQEQKEGISNASPSQEAFINQEKELVPQEQKAELSERNEAIDLNNFDPDEYEIEEYEVEVDEDDDVADEIVVIDESEPVRQINSNVPKE